MSSLVDSLVRRLRRARWLAVPLAAYLIITLVLPAANGAAARTDFVRHAAWVVAACVTVVGIVVVTGAVIDVLQSVHLRRRDHGQNGSIV